METVTIVGWLRLIHLPLVSLAVSIVLRLTATRVTSLRSAPRRGVWREWRSWVSREKAEGTGDNRGHEIDAALPLSTPSLSLPIPSVSLRAAGRSREAALRDGDRRRKMKGPGVEWRKRLPRLLGLVSPSVLALRLSPSLITIPGGAGPFGRHDDGGRERPKGPESEGNRGRPLTSLVLSLIPSVFHSARVAASRRSPCLALVPRARLRLTPIVMSGERREWGTGQGRYHKGTEKDDDKIDSVRPSLRSFTHSVRSCRLSPRFTRNERSERRVKGTERELTIISFFLWHFPFRSRLTSLFIN